MADPIEAYLIQLSSDVVRLIKAHPKRMKDLAAGLLGTAIAVCDQCDFDVLGFVRHVRKGKPS